LEVSSLTLVWSLSLSHSLILSPSHLSHPLTLLSLLPRCSCSKLKYSPTALTLFRYTADVDGKDVEVDFWDTAGQERFSSMHPSYYFGAHACILAFDVTRKVTYKNLNDWYKELRKYRENIPVILVANKIDVDYKVTQKKFAFGQKKGLPFEFVSAADGTNVVRVFKDAIRAGVEYKMGDKKDFMDDVRSTTLFVTHTDIILPY